MDEPEEKEPQNQEEWDQAAVDHWSKLRFWDYLAILLNVQKFRGRERIGWDDKTPFQKFRLNIFSFCIVAWTYYLEPLPKMIYWFPQHVACEFEYHKWQKSVEPSWGWMEEQDFPHDTYWLNNCKYCGQHRGINIDTWVPKYRRYLKNERWKPKKKDLLPVKELQAWYNLEPNRGWRDIKPGEWYSRHGSTDRSKES